MRRIAVALLLASPALGAPGRPAAAQGAAAGPAARPARYTVGWGDAASLGAAGTLFVLPAALELPQGTPACGSPTPCDPATLPGVDRWALTTVHPAAGGASTVVLGGVGALAGYLALHGLPRAQWQGNAAALANAAAWTAATSEWLKVLVHRRRPVLYTAAAPAAYAERESRESWPSGHTALAFAAATSYLVISGREQLPHRARNAILLYAGAVGVAVLRVAAGQHFPTDVVGGAALGTGVGWLVPTIHPRVP
jgi:membrane-associated phospholipid phosphatase